MIGRTLCMPETPDIHEDQSATSPVAVASVPSYESNLLWGGVGSVLTVVGAMKHNLLWILWIAWICFIFTLYIQTRRMPRFRGVSRIVGFFLVSGILLGLRIWLSPAPYVPSPALTPPVVTAHAIAPQQMLDTSKQSPPKHQEKPVFRRMITGKDNTVVGKTPYGSISGNGNTIVGATDANGNTILNQGGLAVGNGAKADSSSVAIGAYAGAGSAVPPTYEQKCEGSACAQGPGSQATFNQYGEPRRLIKSNSLQGLKSTLGANPGVVFIKSNSNGDDLAQQLFGIFKDAGWRISISTIIGQGLPDGVQVKWKGPSQTDGTVVQIPDDRPDVKAIVNVMQASDIRGLTGFQDPGLADHQIVIEIGGIAK